METSPPSERFVRAVLCCETPSMIVAIGARHIVKIRNTMTDRAIALLHYFVVGITRIVVSTVRVTCLAKIRPFPPASRNDRLKPVNLSSYKIKVRRAMGLVAIRTGQNIATALRILIR